MYFAFPEVFFMLFIAAPLLVVQYRSGNRNRQNVAAYHGNAPTSRYLTARLALTGLFLFALIAVAARPYTVHVKGVNLLFLADVSRSMQARFSCSEPTFLERSKTVMRKLLQAIPEANFGIFAFDRFAFPVTQMSSDRAYLDDVIEHGLYVGLTLEATQTQLANALSVVASKKERLPGIYGNVSQLVLLSDGYVGGDYRRRLQKPLDRLREMGIAVTAVGIGNARETPIARSDAGRCTGRHIEVDGRKILIPLRADVLAFVARETGGAYYTEAESGKLIRELRSNLKEREYGSSRRADGRRHDFTWPFLALATLAMSGILYFPVGSILSPDRDSGGGRRPGYPNAG